MSYKDLLHMYGSEQESAEQRVYIYAVQPKKLKTFRDVQHRDADAEQKISQLEKLIEDLKDYRIALAARYGELSTMSYKTRLLLERAPHWKGHIEYIVTMTRTMEDGTAIEDLREVYKGKDRKQAFKRFEELKKSHPGIDAAQDIERRHWER